MNRAWAARLRWALRLGLAPDAFWRLSVAEWRALTEAEAFDRLGGRELQALIAAHPDGDDHVRG